jgi:Chalcone isomerase-like
MPRILSALSMFFLALLPLQPLAAAEVSGVKLPDSVKVGGADLLLNGAGLRVRMMFKIYVGALYLPEKKTAAAAALDARGAKRVALHLLRDLSAEQLTGALSDGLDENLSDAERAQFKVQIDDLKAVMATVGAAREGSIVTLDFVPGDGTRMGVDGLPKGKPITGEDFYRALLKIWLGDKPVDKSLKAAMLGQG